MTAAVTVRGLRASYGGPDVLRGLDLDVPAGSLAAVLGPSGCGKTTLLRALAGFEPATGGTVALGERVLTGPGVHVAPERRRIGIVPQEGALFPHLDVAGNVAFGLRRGPVRSRAARRVAADRVHELLDLVGLSGYERRMPGELSGGQQQRVALARALAPQPDLVLLDEPFSALDAGLRVALREDVRSVLATSGATALLVTHDQDEALSVADVVCVLRDGVVVQSGAPVEVYDRPVDAGVATLLGAATVLAATLDGPVAQTPLGPVAVHPVEGRPVDGAGRRDPARGTVVVRPERVVLDGTGLPGTVLRSRFESGTALVRVLVDAGPGTVATQGTEGVEVVARTTLRPAPGERVCVRLDGPVPFLPEGSG